MRKPTLLQPLDDFLGTAQIHNSSRKAITTADNLTTRNLDQRHRLRIAGLEAYCRPRRDVEAVPVRLNAIKLEQRIRLDEVIVTTNLNRPIALVGNTQLATLAAGVESDLLALDGDHGARLAVRRIHLRLREREQVLRRHGQKRAVQCGLQVAIVTTDRIVDRHQIRAVRKRALDLDLGQQRGYRGQHVPSPQHRLAQVLQRGDAVHSVADMLLEVVGDQRGCFYLIQLQPPRETPLREEADLAYDQLVEL
jgi:hypothetical protein